MWKKVLSMLVCLSFINNVISIEAGLTTGTLSNVSHSVAEELLVGIRITGVDSVTYLFRPSCFDGGKTKQIDSVDPRWINKLLSYFYSALVIPKENWWVNLSVFVPPSGLLGKGLENTKIGYVLMDADLRMKVLANKILNEELGDELWSRLESMGIEALNPRFWMVPGSIEVKTIQNGVRISRAEIDVKVEIENDNLSEQHRREIKTLLESEVLPRLKHAINTSPEFAELRQVYYAMALAAWFKEKARDISGLFSALVDSYYLPDSGLLRVDREGFWREFSKWYFLSERDYFFLKAAGGGFDGTKFNPDDYKEGGGDNDSLITIERRIPQLKWDPRRNVYLEGNNIRFSPGVYAKIANAIIVNLTKQPLIISEEFIREHGLKDIKNVVIMKTGPGELVVWQIGGDDAEKYFGLLSKLPLDEVTPIFSGPPEKDLPPVIGRVAKYNKKLSGDVTELQARSNRVIDPIGRLMEIEKAAISPEMSRRVEEFSQYLAEALKEGKDLSSDEVREKLEEFVKFCEANHWPALRLFGRKWDEMIKEAKGTEKKWLLDLRQHLWGLVKEAMRKSFFSPYNALPSDIETLIDLKKALQIGLENLIGMMDITSRNLFSVRVSDKGAVNKLVNHDLALLESENLGSALVDKLRSVSDLKDVEDAKALLSRIKGQLTEKQRKVANRILELKEMRFLYEERIDSYQALIRKVTEEQVNPFKQHGRKVVMFPMGGRVDQSTHVWVILTLLASGNADRILVSIPCTGENSSEVIWRGPINELFLEYIFPKALAELIYDPFEEYPGKEGLALIPIVKKKYIGSQDILLYNAGPHHMKFLQVDKMPRDVYLETSRFLSGLPHHPFVLDRETGAIVPEGKKALSLRGPEEQGPSEDLRFPMEQVDESKEEVLRQFYEKLTGNPGDPDWAFEELIGKIIHLLKKNRQGEVGKGVTTDKKGGVVLLLSFSK